MVLAVNWPPQEPPEGQAASSRVCRSASLMVPAAWRPTPSKTSTMVTSLFWKRPGRIEPPYMKTAGTLRRTMTIISPGSDLSQPARPTSAS